ncbi:MAG: DUF4423 domain-containing protein [Bdellovibrionota bacterium]|nr:DUF4423 domain-containing protein [Bdellovibrionota bacterium]
MVKKEYYIEALKNELLERCQNNPQYSLSSYARDLGLSQSALSKVLSGQKKLSLKRARLIVQKLKLNKVEQENFFMSVSFNHDPNKVVLNASLGHIIEDPIYNLILNTLKLDDFESSLDWISSRVKQDRKTVELAMRTLELAKLIRLENNKWVRSFPKTESYDQISPESQKRFHKAILRKAMSSLDEFPSEQRQITGVTMSIDPDQLDAAAREISRFRQKISKTLEGGKKTRVYHLEIGLFPL